MSLTIFQIDNAKPQAKPYKLFDGKGLYIEVAPTGARWWRFKYRIAGKEKRISLGVYPDVGLKDARDKLDEVRRQLASNIGPMRLPRFRGQYGYVVCRAGVERNSNSMGLT